MENYLLQPQTDQSTTHVLLYYVDKKTDLMYFNSHTLYKVYNTLVV